MSKSPSKESDIPALSHIGTSVERHSSVVHSACTPPRAGFLSAALGESSL